MRILRKFLENINKEEKTMSLEQLNKRYHRLLEQLRMLEQDFASDYNIKIMEEIKDEVCIIYKEIKRLEGER